MVRAISIHAPLVGRDQLSPSSVSSPHHFNPRAPRGARPAVYGDARLGRIISIHAPLVGRDKVCAGATTRRRYFNPRAPRGARLRQAYLMMLPRKFQSTRPSWGATARLDCLLELLLISIHAPLVGRDIIELYQKPLLRISIHAPLVGRDGGALEQAAAARISIHAPLVGRDRSNHAHQGLLRISIHAPLVGRDMAQPCANYVIRHFNPRAPRGARPEGIGSLPPLGQFQSTRPSRGATSFGGFALLV